MVEFDDGDRGRISLPNIRLLPPGYQIHCECPAPLPPWFIKPHHVSDVSIAPAPS